MVNEVLRKFNGLGQLTAEYQSDSGGKCEPMWLPRHRRRPPVTNDPPAEPDNTPNLVSYIFDAHNRLVATRDLEGRVASFADDAEGRRIDDSTSDPFDDNPDEPHVVG